MLHRFLVFDYCRLLSFAPAVGRFSDLSRPLSRPSWTLLPNLHDIVDSRAFPLWNAYAPRTSACTCSSTSQARQAMVRYLVSTHTLFCRILEIKESLWVYGIIQLTSPHSRFDGRPPTETPGFRSSCTLDDVAQHQNNAISVKRSLTAYLACILLPHPSLQ